LLNTKELEKWADATTTELIVKEMHKLNGQISFHYSESISTCHTPHTTMSVANYNYNTTLLQPILHAITQLNEGLIERDTEVKLMLLAVLCREHIVLLGPPGTGELVRT
jgi:hypothetical protein